MGVYIHGMEMPKSCAECRFSVDGWCYVLRPESEEERERIKTNYCPLIEIPDCDWSIIKGDELPRCPSCGGTLSELRINGKTKWRHCFSCHFEFGEDET